MRVLQVGAEVFPLIKTGGLADVLGALPQALAGRGSDVRMLLPGLPAILDAAVGAQPVRDIGPAFGAARVRLLLGRMPRSPVPMYLVDAPSLYRRPGNPYHDSDGSPWPDNLQRFGLLGWVAAQLACGELDPDWVPDIAHAHDWHAAMTCAYLTAHPGAAAASVFTVHNLAYQGLFAQEDCGLLGLPASFMSPSGLEYHGQLSFMKAGLKFADRITTVSPTYAHEIATPEFGAGLDGVIRGRSTHVSGILNGIDEGVWSPTADAALDTPYGTQSLEGKRACKAALQREFGIEPRDDAPLFGVVSRLTAQKGLDLVLSALPDLVRLGCQLVVQGSGEPALESAFRMAATAHPGRVGVVIGYDENRAHRLIAGADVILVPSRFEPCGLTQMYGLRYGTVPLVRRVGGLADTVVDATIEALEVGAATGFVFDAPTPAALTGAVERALACLRNPPLWRQLMLRGMAQPLSWDGPARRYLKLYEQALASRRSEPRRAPR